MNELKAVGLAWLSLQSLQSMTQISARGRVARGIHLLMYFFSICFDVDKSEFLLSLQDA